MSFRRYGYHTTLANQGVASLVLCKVSKKCSYQDTGMSLLLMLTYYCLVYLLGYVLTKFQVSGKCYSQVTFFLHKLQFLIIHSIVIFRVILTIMYHFAFGHVKCQFPQLCPFHEMFKSSCKVFAWSVVAKSLVSSAKIHTLLFTMSGMSFTYMINNMGPRTLPWGTPLSTGFHVEELPLTDTHCRRSDKKLEIHDSTAPFIPYEEIFFNSLDEPLYQRLWPGQIYCVPTLMLLNILRPSLHNMKKLKWTGSATSKAILFIW